MAGGTVRGVAALGRRLFRGAPEWLWFLFWTVIIRLLLSGVGYYGYRCS